MSKYKIGDRVRTFGDYSWGKGEGIIEKIDSGLYYVKLYWGENDDWKTDFHSTTWSFKEDELELLLPLSNCIVHTPTKEDFIRVVKYVFANGGKWRDKQIRTNEDYWEEYKDQTCVQIREKKMSYSPKHYYLEENYQIISTNQFFGETEKEQIAPPNYGWGDWGGYPINYWVEYLQGVIAPTDKPKKTIMSVIKDIFKSKEARALSHYNITNGDGGLTDIGKNEFVDYLWETDQETRKSFIAKIVEKYEEDIK